MVAAFDYWKGKCEAATFGPFPVLTDLDLLDLIDVIGYLTICDVVRQDSERPRYRWRFWGTELTNYFNIEMSGKFVDEAYTPTTAQQVIGCYDWILETRQSHYWLRHGGIVSVNSDGFSLNEQNAHKSFDRLACPVIDQSGAIAHLFGVMTFKKPAITQRSELVSGARGDII